MSKKPNDYKVTINFVKISEEEQKRRRDIIVSTLVEGAISSFRSKKLTP